MSTSRCRRLRTFRARTLHGLRSGVALAAALLSASASALTIVPTFTGTLSSTLQNDIDAAIGVYQDTFAGSHLRVAIDFQTMTDGLGESESGYVASSYASFRGALVRTATTQVGAQALAGLPATMNNPLFGNPPPRRWHRWGRWDYRAVAMPAAPDLYLTTANARALGMRAAPQVAVGNARYDGVVFINPAAGSYDYTAVAMHEIDEVLGLGSALDLNGSWRTPRYAMPEDLYRYAANGVRSFTYDPNVVAYFSLNGKITATAPQFNQDPNGDYGDWCSAAPSACAHFGLEVQNAFATPGRTVTLGSPEITALEAIGYNGGASAAAGPLPASTLTLLHKVQVAPVPLPAPAALLCTPLPALLRRRRRSRLR